MCVTSGGVRLRDLAPEQHSQLSSGDQLRQHCSRIRPGQEVNSRPYVPIAMSLTFIPKRNPYFISLSMRHAMFPPGENVIV